jgi:hypothetical protein
MISTVLSLILIEEFYRAILLEVLKGAGKGAG